MKKIFATLSLALFAATASAAGPTVGVTYDLNVARHSTGSSFDRGHEGKVFVAQETKLGTFDAGLLVARFSATKDDNANGFEVGYSNGFAYQKFGVTGRVGYGRLNSIDPNGGGFTGNSSYVSLGVEGSMPVTSSMNAFAGYRHRNGLGDMYAQNRYTAGVDYAINKSIALRAGYAHTRQAGYKANGLTTQVSYSF